MASMGKLVSRAEHYIGSDGYRCAIEREQPNTSEGATKATQASTDDEVQASVEA